MQKIELEKKPYNILNLVFDLTLLISLLILTTYSIILSIYLATYIKNSTL